MNFNVDLDNKRSKFYLSFSECIDGDMRLLHVVLQGLWITSSSRIPNNVAFRKWMIFCPEVDDLYRPEAVHLTD